MVYRTLGTSLAALAVVFAAARHALASPVDFNFSISYSGSSITGRLIGLNVDAQGNGTEVDPTSVLLFSAPASVGLGATPANPYVFVPRTFQRSTLFMGTLSSTMPGVYGFQISHYNIVPSMQNLLMRDVDGDVTLVFNYGASVVYQGGDATYGIQAEEDALWPAVNTGVGFSIVAIPPPVLVGDANDDCAVGAADYAVWAAQFGQVGAGLSADFDGNGSIGAGDYALWAANFGTTCSTGGSSVPEPAAAALVLAGLIGLAAARGRRRLRGGPAA